MEPTNRESSEKASGINLTAIIIVLIVCATFIGALFVLKGASQSVISIDSLVPSAKPEVPVFITWRETKWPGETQVARIWAKPEGQFPLRVRVQIESSVSGEKMLREIVLERSEKNEPYELGWPYHMFVPGDKITVNHKDYSLVTATCKPLK